ELLAELIVRHRRARHADHVEAGGQPLAAREVIHRREQFAARQIAGRAEDDECRRRGRRLDAQPLEQGGGSALWHPLTISSARYGFSSRYLSALGVASTLSCCRARRRSAGSCSVRAIRISSSSSFTVKSAVSTAGRESRPA